MAADGPRRKETLEAEPRAAYPSLSTNGENERGGARMTLAFFHADGCGVCHEKAPLVDRLSADAGLPLERWDVDDPAGAAEKARRRIRTVPTLALVDGERVRFRLAGAMITPENVRHLLKQSGATARAGEGGA